MREFAKGVLVLLILSALHLAAMSLSGAADGALIASLTSR